MTAPSISPSHPLSSPLPIARFARKAECKWRNKGKCDFFRFVLPLFSCLCFCSVYYKTLIISLDWVHGLYDNRHRVYTLPFSRSVPSWLQLLPSFSVPSSAPYFKELPTDVPLAYSQLSAVAVTCLYYTYALFLLQKYLK